MRRQIIVKCVRDLYGSGIYFIVILLTLTNFAVKHCEWLRVGEKRSLMFLSDRK